MVFRKDRTVHIARRLYQREVGLRVAKRSSLLSQTLKDLSVAADGVMYRDNSHRNFH